MRRLPIYFLIDVSESMVGAPIQQVQDGIATIIKELRTDPHALETVHISVIAFAGRAQTISPLTELATFYPPKLPIGGGTSLGNALNFLMDDMSRTVAKTTLEKKGDWKPIVFLFTDGNPTDHYDTAFTNWNEKCKNSANLIAISLGNNMNTSILNKITDNVLRLNSTDEDSFKAFFKWITASIKTNSVSVNELNTDELKLAPFSDDILTKIELEMSLPEVVDENFAVMLAKCQKTKQPYLIKYEKNLSANPYSQYVSNSVNKYTLVGAYPIDNTYFDLLDGQPLGATVNTRNLMGFPHCPCCGNEYGFSVCRCTRMMCVGNEQTSECPWCGNEAHFGFSENASDISRTRG